MPSCSRTASGSKRSECSTRTALFRYPRSFSASPATARPFEYPPTAAVIVLLQTTRMAVNLATVAMVPSYEVPSNK
jgi:hypothetical protein